MATQKVGAFGYQFLFVLDYAQNRHQGRLPEFKAVCWASSWWSSATSRRRAVSSSWSQAIMVSSCTGALTPSDDPVVTGWLSWSWSTSISQVYP